MDFARSLHELWRHRGWLVLGLVASAVLALSTAYDFVGVPPRLEKEALAIGTATTTLLVDTPDSAVTDLAADLRPLAARAVVFARLASTRPVRRDIARRVGVREEAIVIEAPIDDAVRPQAPRDTRITSILAEDSNFRVAFIAQNGLPLIQVSAQAPRVDDAVRLAAASADAFKAYIRTVQAREQRPASRRVLLREITTPAGGLVAKEVNVQLAVLAFIASFIGVCLLVLAVSGVARNLRAIQTVQQPASDAGDGEQA